MNQFEPCNFELLPKKIFHYSGKPVKKLRSDYWEKPKNRIFNSNGAKPIGLWVSLEDHESENNYNWEQWCRAEDFCVEDLKYKHLISLKENAKILLLDTPEKIKDFSYQYADNDINEMMRDFTLDNIEEFKHLIPDGPLKEHLFNRKYVYKIKWHELKNQFDGIFITPYQLPCRYNNDTFWYYGWDCSSGCIWNIDIIDKLEINNDDRMPVLSE